MTIEWLPRAVRYLLVFNRDQGIQTLGTSPARRAGTNPEMGTGRIGCAIGEDDVRCWGSLRSGDSRFTNRQPDPPAEGTTRC